MSSFFIVTYRGYKNFLLHSCANIQILLVVTEQNVSNLTIHKALEKSTLCHPEPFAFCHSEQSEESLSVPQDKLREWSRNIMIL